MVTAGGLPVSVNEVHATAESARRGSRCRAETPANVFLRGGMGSCHINM